MLSIPTASWPHTHYVQSTCYHGFRWFPTTYMLWKWNHIRILLWRGNHVGDHLGYPTCFQVSRWIALKRPLMTLHLPSNENEVEKSVSEKRIQRLELIVPRVRRSPQEECSQTIGPNRWLVQGWRLHHWAYIAVQRIRMHLEKLFDSIHRTGLRHEPQLIQYRLCCRHDEMTRRNQILHSNRWIYILFFQFPPGQTHRTGFSM